MVPWFPTFHASALCCCSLHSGFPLSLWINSNSIAMVRSSLLYYYSQRRVAFRRSFFIPTTLALLTSFFILLYIYSTSNLFTHHHHNHQSTPIFKSLLPFSPTPHFKPFLHHNNASHPTKSLTFQLGHAQPSQSQRGLPPQFSSEGTPKFQSFLLILFWVGFFMWFLTLLKK